MIDMDDPQQSRPASVIAMVVREKLRPTSLTSVEIERLAQIIASEAVRRMRYT